MAAKKAEQFSAARVVLRELFGLLDPMETSQAELEALEREPRKPRKNKKARRAAKAAQKQESQKRASKPRDELGRFTKPKKK